LSAPPVDEHERAVGADAAQVYAADTERRRRTRLDALVELVALVCLLLSVVVIGLLLLPVVGLAALVLTVIAGIKANEGQRYRYPFCWRPIK
jgi:uncharacterized membrane protein